MSFDQSIFQAINGLANKFTVLDLSGIFFASYFPYLLIIIFIAIIFLEKNWKIRFYNFSLVTLSIILARGLFIEFIRFVYYRPRPALVLPIDTLISTPTVSSFPSGHTAVFFALAMAVFYFNKRLSLWFWAAAIVIGLARIFVGVHWPLDILAGILVGILSAAIVEKILMKSIPKLAKKSP